MSDAQARCNCGEAFSNASELRLHIALETKGFPMKRCSRRHHDPSNEGDITALRWLCTSGQEDPE